MKASLLKMLAGYREFKQKYAIGDHSVMKHLASLGQSPEIMIVSCCDSRVDPALILQCDPGDLFVVRNIANIIPPYEKDDKHHGTSAALEYGICYLKVKHFIILGHSQCGGIEALLNENNLAQNDFIGRWVSLLKTAQLEKSEFLPAQKFLLSSYQNLLTFPWVKEKLDTKKLSVHLWYFDIKEANLYAYSSFEKKFELLL